MHEFLTPAQSNANTIVIIYAAAIFLATVIFVINGGIYLKNKKQARYNANHQVSPDKLVRNEDELHKSKRYAYISFVFFIAAVPYSIFSLLRLFVF